MAIAPLGTFIGNTTRVNNALVEEVSCLNNSNGNMLISYSTDGRNHPASIQRIRLNLTRNTAVVSSFGQNMCSCCIQRGMRVNVVFDACTTRSIPPQSNAILVAVQNTSPLPQPPRPPQLPSPAPVTTGRIILIDFNNNYLIMEAPNNRSSQTRFNITNATTFTNRFGFPIRFRSLQTGQIARITHANFQTASIPPQTTAFHVQLL